MDTEGIASVSIITFAKVDVLLDFYVFFFLSGWKRYSCSNETKKRGIQYNV